MSRSSFSAAMQAFESADFERHCAAARKLLSGLFGPDGFVRFATFRDLDGYITGQCGFQFTMAGPLLEQPSGRDTLYIQWFYQFGHVWVRLKNQPRRTSKSGHMLVALATGDAWDEEVCKFTRNGDLIVKQGFIRRLWENNDYRSHQRVGATAEEVYQVEDAWADLCHFNLPDNFDWSGAEQYI